MCQAAAVAAKDSGAGAQQECRKAGQPGWNAALLAARGLGQACQGIWDGGTRSTEHGTRNTEHGTRSTGSAVTPTIVQYCIDVDAMAAVAACHVKLSQQFVT